jgi:hypothetical protein
VFFGFDYQMTRYHYQTRRDAERRYPHRVDIPVPPNGLGGRLNEMLAWCRERLTEWEHHGVTAGRDERGVASDAVRFYFMDEIAARQFRERWAPIAP